MVNHLIGAEVDKNIQAFAQDMARNALNQVKTSLAESLKDLFDKARTDLKIEIKRA